MAPTLRPRTKQQLRSPVATRKPSASRPGGVSKSKDKNDSSKQKQIKKARKPARARKTHSASSTPTVAAPENPAACFLGLPAELRREIYNFVYNASIIHVHMHEAETEADGTVKPMRFTWTPCRATNPKYPILCLNPKWSGLCREAHRCSHRLGFPVHSKSMVGGAALTATCKYLRDETQEFCFNDSTVSLPDCHVTQWLDFLQEHAPSSMRRLRRVTVTHATPGCFGGAHPRNIDCALQTLQARVPNLQAFGVQRHYSQRLYSGLTRRMSYFSMKWRNWTTLHQLGTCKRGLTVMIEDSTWLRLQSRKPKDVILVSRILRKGTQDDWYPVKPKNMNSQILDLPRKWPNQDVEVEGFIAEAVEKRTPRWKRWPELGE